MKNILPHSTFHSADFFQDEKKLLQKCWFFAGLKSQLQNSQDYITAEHFGFPVVIINSENQYRGFANRCLHRGSPIVKINSCGTGALKCQYHGWLYHNDGNIKTIPFANSFPETPKGKLAEIKVETCGELVFYATQENPLTLKEYLGDFYQELKKLSSYMTSIHHKEQYSIKANWKANIENALESYHVAHIHEATFVGIMDLNPKAGSEHFQKYHSSWETNLEEKTASKIKKMEKIFSHENFPVAGYKHYFIFPNLAIATTSGFSFGIQVYNPTTENTTDFIHLVIAPQNKNQVLAKHFLDAVTQFNSTVFKEDCAICEQVQINLSSQKEPFYYSELFEKRLIHFQQNLKDILL